MCKRNFKESYEGAVLSGKCVNELNEFSSLLTKEGYISGNLVKFVLSSRSFIVCICVSDPNPL